MTASERALRLVKAQSDELRAAYAQLLRALADDIPDAQRYCLCNAIVRRRMIALRLENQKTSTFFDRTNPRKTQENPSSTTELNPSTNSINGAGAVNSGNALRRSNALQSQRYFTPAVLLHGLADEIQGRRPRGKVIAEFSLPE